MEQSKEHMNKDLTICGICLLVIEEPKALPCLHSYCLKCLSKWAEGKTDKVKCPVCAQEFLIPSEGISGFTTNFFINTLKDRRVTAQTLQAKHTVIPCLCCGESDHKAVAYCTDCGGFICEECGKAHTRVRTLKNHSTVPFEDLQTGKVDVRNLSQKKYCKEHDGQVLRFYCQTCEDVICLECTIIDHPGSSHKLVKLRDVVGEQRSDIKELQKDCEIMKAKVERAIEETNDVFKDIEENNTKLREQLHEVSESFIANITSKVKSIEDEVNQMTVTNRKHISSQKDYLAIQQTRLCTALQMANEVTQTGSDYDIAAVYTSLKNNLMQLRELNQDNLEQKVRLPTFNSNICGAQQIPSLGTVTQASRSGKWSPHDNKPAFRPGKIVDCRSNVASSTAADISIRKSSFDSTLKVGEESNTFLLVNQYDFHSLKGEDRLQNGFDITEISKGSFGIADAGENGGKGVKIYDHNGMFKLIMAMGTAGNSAVPWNLVHGSEGKLFVTHQTPIVMVYSVVTGLVTNQFSTNCPKEESKNWSTRSKTSALMGLAMDTKENILVGEVNQQYISKHQQNGLQIASFRVSIPPWYIAVSSRDEIIVSYGRYLDGSKANVQILDSEGNLLCKVNAPDCVTQWFPFGLCCSVEKIYIANSMAGSDGGIYCYSTSGKYLGCLIKELEFPTGITLAENKRKLLVLQNKCVKMFSTTH